MSSTVKIVTAEPSSIATQRVKKAAQLLADARKDDAALVIQEAATIEEAALIADHAGALEKLTRRRDDAAEAHDHAFYILQHARRRIGQLALALPKDKGGRPWKDAPEPGPAGETVDSPTTVVSKKAQLKAMGISRAEEREYERMARIEEDEFEKRVERSLGDAKKKGRPSSITRRTASSAYDPDSCCTPAKYIEAAREVCGGVFGIDPASNAFAQNTVRALRFYTKEDSGLALPTWETEVGTAWLNQPYSRGIVGDFANKLCDEYEAKRIRIAVNLVNSATDTTWYQRMIRTCSAMCLPDHRIAFEIMGAPIDEKFDQNLYSQTFFYLGPDRALFARVFKQFGAVTVPLLDA